MPEGFCFRCNSRRCHCKSSDPMLRHITAPFIYTDGVKEIITSLKFRKQKHLVRLLSEEISKKVIEDFSDISFDFVTFVPMTDKARKRRGYNQSEIIARQTAKRLFLPCVDTLIKSKETPKQHYLSAESRQKNLADALSLKDGAQLKGKTILICDDIKTTGSTLLICEQLLLKAGAADVYCAVAAIPVFGNAGLSIDKETKNL